MARASGKTMKVDVALPLDIFETVVRLAKESDAPIHHRSNQRVLSTTIIRLIGLGIQSIADNPELLTAPISGRAGLDPRVTALVDRIGKLEDESKERDGLTRDDVQSIIAEILKGYVSKVDMPLALVEYTNSFITKAEAQLVVDDAIELLQTAGLDSINDEPECDGWTIKEFSEANNLGVTRKDGVEAVRAALAEAGLDDEYFYKSSTGKIYEKEAED